MLTHRLALVVPALACIIGAQEVSPETRVEAMLPELLSKFLEEQKVSQEYSNLGHGPPILWIDFLAFSAQKPQIIPDEVTLLTPHIQLELLLEYLPEAIEVVCLMRVVIVLADPFFNLWKHPHCLAVGNEVSLSRSDLLIPSLEVFTAIDAGDRPEVNQPPSMIPINHDIHLLQIPMYDLLLIEKQ